MLLAKGERLYEEMLGEERDKVAYFLREFERVLLTQNEKEIKKAAKVFNEQLETIERWMYSR